MAGRRSPGTLEPLKDLGFSNIILMAGSAFNNEAVVYGVFELLQTKRLNSKTGYFITAANWLSTDLPYLSGREIAEIRETEEFPDVTYYPYWQDNNDSDFRLLAIRQEGEKLIVEMPKRFERDLFDSFYHEQFSKEKGIIGVWLINPNRIKSIKKEMRLPVITIENSRDFAMTFYHYLTGKDFAEILKCEIDKTKELSEISLKNGHSFLVRWDLHHFESLDEREDDWRGKIKVVKDRLSEAGFNVIYVSKEDRSNIDPTTDSKELGDTIYASPQKAESNSDRVPDETMGGGLAGNEKSLTTQANFFQNNLLKCLTVSEAFHRIKYFKARKLARRVIIRSNTFRKMLGRDSRLLKSYVKGIYSGVIGYPHFSSLSKIININRNYHNFLFLFRKYRPYAFGFVEFIIPGFIKDKLLFRFQSAQFRWLPGGSTNSLKNFFFSRASIRKLQPCVITKMNRFGNVLHRFKLTISQYLEVVKLFARIAAIADEMQNSLDGISGGLSVEPLVLAPSVVGITKKGSVFTSEDKDNLFSPILMSKGKGYGGGVRGKWQREDIKRQKRKEKIDRKQRKSLPKESRQKK